MSRIIILDHLDPAKCDQLIKIYHKNELGAHTWPTMNKDQDMFPLNFKKVFVEKEFLQDVVNEVMDCVTSYFDNVELEWGELVYRLKGCASNWHFDVNSRLTALTSLTYLNDNFDGGETCFRDGTKIKPVKGRTLIFDGMHYEHMVEENSDVRYVMPIWYKNKGE